MLPAGRVLALAVLLHAGIACAAGPTAAQLESDNPIRPNADPPFGMDDFFKEAPQQPHPARVRLGRWLFYDVRLSANRTVSCASCHRPSHAFSEPTAVSTRHQRRPGTRKTPSIVNLAARTVLPDLPGRSRATLFLGRPRHESREPGAGADREREGDGPRSRGDDREVLRASRVIGRTSARHLAPMTSPASALRQRSRITFEPG